MIDHKCAAVPLAEQLRSVPWDAVLRIDTPNALGCMDTRSIPVGRLCHEAADALGVRVDAPPSRIIDERITRTNAGFVVERRDITADGVPAVAPAEPTLPDPDVADEDSGLYTYYSEDAVSELAQAWRDYCAACGVDVPRKITSVAEFCAEAERIGLTAEALAEALSKRPEFADCLPTAGVPEVPALNGPEFTDWGRAALLWVLWHHQGGSSPVGQPIRFALGMGQHDHLSDSQIAEAKRWAELTRTAGVPASDGDRS